MIKRFIKGSEVRAISKLVTDDMDLEQQNLLYKESIQILEDKLDSLRLQISSLTAEKFVLESKICSQKPKKDNRNISNNLTEYLSSE